MDDELDEEFGDECAEMLIEEYVDERLVGELVVLDAPSTPLSSVSTSFKSRSEFPIVSKQDALKIIRLRFERE
jgi:hypothetical protein